MSDVEWGRARFTGRTGQGVVRFAEQGCPIALAQLRFLRRQDGYAS